MKNDYNFLVVWNAVAYSEPKAKLVQLLKDLLCKHDSEIILKITFAFSQSELDSFLTENNFTHIIVLCELTWENKRFTDFYGVELVKQQIRVKYNNRKAINLPILFVSFCSREQIVRLDQTKEIVNTYGLRNHFIQLPKATEKEVSDFWKMKPATELEMIDTLHFCAYDKMIASIRHGLGSQSLVRLKHKIIDIISKIDEQLNLTELKKQFISCESKENFKQLCDNLESILSSQLLKTSDLVYKGKFKVLLIDDEITDSVILLQEEAKDYLIIEHVNNTESALKILKDDYYNEYQVVICDYRIFDNPLDITKQTMLYPQGYTFIEQAARLGHLYKFISFSGLPRAFRIAVAEKLNIRIETVDKDLMICTTEGRKAFSDKIIDLALENIEQIASIASDDYYFKTLIIRVMLEKKLIEIEVAEEASKLINIFKNNLDPNKKNEIIINPDNNFAKIWNEIKSNFALQSDTEIKEPDHDFYITELTRIVKAVKSNHKRFKNAGEEINFDDFNEFVSQTIEDNGKLSDTNNIYLAIDQLGKNIFKNIILQNKKDDNKTIAKQIYDEIKSQTSSYDYLIDNYKNDTIKYKDPYDDDILEKFIGKLIARRFAIYCYYWLSENYDIDEIKDIKGLTHAVNRILTKGYLGSKGLSDRGICSKGLFLCPKNKRIKDIKELYHISMTIEEQNFFRINYPELYEKWDK